MGMGIAVAVGKAWVGGAATPSKVGVVLGVSVGGLPGPAPDNARASRILASSWALDCGPAWVATPPPVNPDGSLAPVAKPGLGAVC